MKERQTERTEDRKSIGKREMIIQISERKRYREDRKRIGKKRDDHPKK